MVTRWSWEFLKDTDSVEGNYNDDSVYFKLGISRGKSEHKFPNATFAQKDKKSSKSSQ